jgi:hypothetical protein
MKKWFVFFVMFCTSLAIYAQYNFEIIHSEHTGNYTNQQFLTEVADVKNVKNMFQKTVGENIVIDQFFQIASEDEDAEDSAMVNWVINNGLPVKSGDGDCFLVKVMRSETDKGTDGWDVLARYSNDSGWSYTLYYFSIYSK